MHEITKRSPSRNHSLNSPVAAALRGIAYQESGSLTGTENLQTPGVAELADGTKSLIGFVTRDITLLGPVLADHIFAAGRLELPFTAGQEASFEEADEFEAEGSYLTLASTGALSAGTALGEEISFLAGKACVKQSGQDVYYLLAAILPAEDSANDFRMRFRKVAP